jgi:hypothetical protein
MEDYDSIGIGFKLAEPLDSGLNANSQPYEMFDGSNDLYVEAVVERRYCATPMKRKFQRTATFVAEETLVVDDIIKETGIVTLPDSEHYRYDENQLEIFVNGFKLSGPSIFDLDPEYIEEFGCYLQSPYEGTPDKIIAPIGEEYSGDQSEFIQNKARRCTKFKILRNLNLGDVITYRITTNVYSYDHINEILDDLETRIDVDLRSSIATKEEIFKFKETIEARVEEAERKVEELNNDVQENAGTVIDQFTVLDIGNMAPDMVQTRIMPQPNSFINMSIKFTGIMEYRLENILKSDYTVLIRRTTSTGHDHYMIPGLDYIIENSVRSDKNMTSVLYLLDREGTRAWATEDDYIYITGLRLGYGR